MRNYLVIFFILITFFITRGIYYSISQGFTIERIAFPESPSTPPITVEADERKLFQDVAGKTFTYLAKGSQSYAFESVDGKWILKLFKCHHWNDASWAENLYLPKKIQDWFNSLVKRRRTKVANMKNSLHIVKTALQDECAVLYMQEYPSQSYSLPVKIIDRASRSYTIDLARYGYALQLKARLIMPQLRMFISKGEKENVKKALSSIVGLLYRRCKKGIWDSDPDLKKNSALIGTTAIHIDIGSFYQKAQFDDLEITKDIQKTTLPLKKWLEREAPEFVPELTALVSNPERATWR